MAKFRDPNPEWPVPVRKLIDGKLDTQYVHNDKELARFTDDPADGGLGYTTQPIPMEWPKLMSHQTLDNLLVHNEAEEAKQAKRGYNYDHWDNAQAQAAKREEAAAPPSFDPKAQARIDLMEKQLEKQSKLIDQLIGSQSKKKSA